MAAKWLNASLRGSVAGLARACAIIDGKLYVGGHLNPVSLTMAHPKSYPGSSGTDMCHFFSSHIAFHTDRSCERTRTPSRFSAPSLHKTHLHTRTANNAARPTRFPPTFVAVVDLFPFHVHDTCATHVQWQSGGNDANEWIAGSERRKFDLPVV